LGGTFGGTTVEAFRSFRMRSRAFAADLSAERFRRIAVVDY
jgi:hypothetical protein